MYATLNNVCAGECSKEGHIFSKLHGLDEAMSIIDGHSLRGIGEEIYDGGHAYCTHYISHSLHIYEEIGLVGKWLRDHSFYQSLW